MTDNWLIAVAIKLYSKSKSLVFFRIEQELGLISYLSADSQIETRQYTEYNAR